jgi:hypothetical protein
MTPMGSRAVVIMVTGGQGYRASPRGSWLEV